MSIQIKISRSDKKFSDNLFDFLKEKSYEFKRQSKIDQIFDSTKTKFNKIEYIKSQSPINLESVYGSTFQTKYRDNSQIYAISHTVEKIEFIGEDLIATIKPNEYGEVIDFEKGYLRPVYYKKDTDSEYSIATFDIDFNIND